MAPKDLEQHFSKAKNALNKKQFSIALEHALRAEDLSHSESDLTEALLLQLAVRNRLQHLKEAIDLQKKISLIDCNNKQFQYETARLFALINRQEDAIALLESLLEKNPEHNSARLELAKLFKEIGELDRAVNHFKHIAFQLDSVNANSEVMLTALAHVAPTVGLDDRQRTVLYDCLANTLEAIPSHSRMGYILARDARRRGDTVSEKKFINAANTMMAHFETSKNNDWTIESIKKRAKKIKGLFDSPSPNWIPSNVTNTEIAPIFILSAPGSAVEVISTIGRIALSIPSVNNPRPWRGAMGKAMHHSGEPKLSDDETTIDRLPTASEDFYRFALETYTQRQAIATGDSRSYLDTQFTNIYWFGLFANLYPRASLLVLREEPLQACLNMLRSPARNMPLLTSPENAAQGLIEIERLIDHWTSLYPDRTISITTEELLRTPESLIEKLASLPGLANCSGINFKQSNICANRLSHYCKEASWEYTGREDINDYSEMLKKAKSILQKHI